MHINKKIRAAAFATMVAAVGLPASAAVINLSPGANLTQAIQDAANGDTIQLAPGTYTSMATGAYPDANSFAITRNVRIIGMGATPADVRLSGGAGGDYAVKFFRYNVTVPASTPPDPSGATIENLTVDTSPGGIQIFNFVAAPNNNRLTGITIKNVVITTKNPGTSNVYGLLVKASDKIVIDNVTVTSYASGFFFVDATESVLMNSTLTRTTDNFAAGVGILGGSKNIVTNNVIGTSKSDPAIDANYSFLSDGLVVYNSSENRVEGNVIQGHRDGGVSVQSRSLAGTVPAPQDTAKSLNNWIGKNNVVSTGYAAGRKDGTGIWTNCSSDASWVYGNISVGAAEAALNVWLVTSNMALGNSFGLNRLHGLGVSGGSETPEFCFLTAYQVKPTNTYLHSNYVFANKNDHINVRNSTSTEVSRNFISPRNGFGAALQECDPASEGFCQSAFALETDTSSSNSNGFRIVANTSAENIRGIFNNDGKVTGVEFFKNRMISSNVRPSVTRLVTGVTVNLDFGASLGGNFWDRSHVAFGNPSASNPYSGIFHNTSNNTGNVVDRFPFQHEDFGRGQTVTVAEPRSTVTAARGSLKTVRWDAPGCTLVDILLDGTTGLRTHTGSTGLNVPNTGYGIVTIPDSASVGAHSIVVQCKDSAGTAKGTGSSSSFNVTSTDIVLVAPGRDEVFDAGQTIFVGWKKATAGAVDVQFSSDGGATFSNLATGVTASFARVALPAIPGTAYGMIRVVSGANMDTTDGVFAVRGTSGAGFTNVSAGRKFLRGELERLEWASPQGSRLVDITATVGATTTTVASNLPDRGLFDWVLGDTGGGTLSLSITFKQVNGTVISSIPATTAGSTLLTTTITFGTTPSISPGSTGSVSATANSGLAVTFTSLTPAVCTVSGTTVTGVAAGSCTLAANQAGSATYAAAPQTNLNFNVGAAQTITFGAAPQVVLNGSGTVSATATSGLTVTFSTLTPTVCLVSGAATVSGIATGTCTIAGNQAGSSSFSAAPQATQTFTVIDATTIPRLVNISTRGLVATGDNIMIGGFIIGGSSPKKVVIRGRGPALADLGVPGTLADPAIRLFNGATPIEFNDNWQSAANQAEVTATGLAPTKPLEAALLTSVSPNVPYTVHVTGVNGSQGIAIVEVFEADRPDIPLLNISTRGPVLTGDHVMIGGFIIQGNAAQQVLIIAKGPSLGQAPFNVPGSLADPKLELYAAGNINPTHTNDNWVDAPNTAAIAATGNAPSSALESAILVTLNPGAYTAIVKGVGAFQGIGLVEVYKK